MVTLVNKTRQSLGRFKILRPKCRSCERDLYEYIQQEGAKVWKRGTGRGSVASYGCKVRYYCDSCKQDIFEGVKLR